MYPSGWRMEEEGQGETGDGVCICLGLMEGFAIFFLVCGHGPVFGFWVYGAKIGSIARSYVCMHVYISCGDLKAMVMVCYGEMKT